MKFFKLVKTLFCYALLGIICIFFVPPLFLIACLPERYRSDNRIFFALLDWFYKLVCRATLCPIIIKGSENLPRTPSILAPNHQSALDIPMVGSLCEGAPHVWLVLEYYASTPLLGFFIRRMFIPVDRNNPQKAARSLIKVYKSIQGKNRHLIIFPEGGRHISGRAQEFFAGFALIARKTGRPVTPIFMPNNRKIYPPGSFYVNTYPFIAIVGKPFMIQPDETDTEFMNRVYQWFVAQEEEYL